VQVFTGTAVLTAVPRIQFLAVEVARNQEGCNDAVSGQKVSHCQTADAATV